MTKQEIPKGYKQTDIGVIPADWDVKKIADLFKITRGQVLSTKKISKQKTSDSPYPVYSSQTQSNGLLGFYKDYLFEDCITWTTDGANAGDVNFRQGKFYCTNVCGVLISSRGYANQFVAESFNRVSKKYVSYVGNPKLMNNVVSDIFISIPNSISEQRVISDVLVDFDILIEKLEKLIAKKLAIKQGTMQELLTGKRRLPGFSGKWENKQLGQLAKIQRGASPRPIDSPIWFDENSTIGWVRISDVTSSGIYLRKTKQRLSLLGIQNSRLVNRGSLIMSICTTVGRPIITEIDVCIHDGFVVFSNLTPDKYYLYYLLKFIEGNWSQHGQTGSQMNLNTGMINKTEIQIPPTPQEQAAIAKILSDMESEIEKLEQKLAKYKMLKQGMMQVLLTGRIRLV